MKTMMNRSSSSIRRLLCVGAAVAMTGLPAVVRADPTECEFDENDDAANWGYVPVRAVAYKNGIVQGYAAASNNTIHDTETTSISFVARPSDHHVTAVATVHVLDAVAHAQTIGPGYGEAGIELRLEVLLNGTEICSDRRTLYIARFNEHGEPAVGVRLFSCDFDKVVGDEDVVTVRVAAHGWISGYGGFSGLANIRADVLDMSITGCGGSCDGVCGGSDEGCFCDAGCVEFGDCCGDFAPSCQPASCWESCGGGAPGGSCFCDDQCADLGDCCSDFAAACG